MNRKRLTRLLSLLCVALVFAMCTAISASALTLNTSAKTVTGEAAISYTSNGSWTMISGESYWQSTSVNCSDHASGVTQAANNDGSVTFTITAESSYSTGSGKLAKPAQHRTTTLTLTNSTSNLLAISYSDSDIPGYSGSGTFYIAANSSVTLSVKADTWADNTSSVCAVGSITITDIQVAVLEDVKFYGTRYGSYTWTVGDASGSVAVGSEAISSSVAGNTSAYANTALTLTVTDVANDGYRFVGWLSDGKLLGTDTTLSTTTDGAMNIYPAFVSEDAAAPFTVDGVDHYFWSTAMNASASSGAPAILTADYTLPNTLLENGLRAAVSTVSGTDGALTYTVPNGAKLLVPHSSDDTGTFSTTIGAAESTNKDRYAYATLTVPGTGKLVVNGALNVNGIQREADTDATSTVTGSYGHIYLEDGGVLSVGNGGNLYCYGYITGGGYVEALSGSKVYEILQIGDWKGGTVTLAWQTAAKSDTNPVFAVSQYFVQNIEADYYFYAGAMEGVTTYLQTFGVCSVDFIGSEGLFNITGGNILRTYDAAADRVTYAVQNHATLDMQSMTIPYSYSIFSGTLNSADYIFGIPNNMTIKAESGSTVNFANDIRMLPGSEVIIEAGTYLNVNADLYLYGTSAWLSGKYCDTSTYSVTAYIATTRASSTRVVGIGTPSAKLQVDGTVTIGTNGGLFSSGTVGDNADIDKVIFGSGTIVNNGAVESRTITEYTRVSSSVEAHSIQFQPAVARLAGKSTSDADYANFGTGTYRGLGEELNHYWYQKAVSVTGEVSEIVNMQGSVVKVNDNGNATAYSVTGGTVRLALADGYAASQNGAFLASSVDSDAVCVVYETTDLDTVIVIGTAEMVNVTVNMVCDGKIGRTLTLSVPSGTKVSGYYTDLACTTAATTVTGGEVLYAYALAWVEWASGTPDIYYDTLDEAMTAAVNSGDTVHLLGDILVDTPYTITADRNLGFSLDGHTITYNSTLFDIYGTLTLDLAGGKIINYYNPSPSATETTDSDGNTVTTYDTAAAEVCALKTQSGGVLNLTVNGGSLGWAVPASYITDYGYSFGSTSYVTPLYNYAGGTVNIDLTSGEIYTDHPGVLSYSAGTSGTYKLPAISNRGTMTITGNGDGEGVIWSSAYNDATGYANNDGTTCYVTVTLHNYGSSADLTLKGVTVNSTSTDAEYISAIYSYNGSAMTLCNTIINANKGYAIYNCGAEITEITDCTINCRSGIYSYKNSNYSASIGSIGGQTTITASGNYGINNRATIGTIGGENANVSITGSLYGIYLYADQEIGQIGGKNATINISQTSAGASSKYYSPIYLGSGAHIGTIGVDETVTGNTKTTVTLTASAYYGIYAAGDIDTIGGENANVSISGTLYGIYLGAGQEIGQIGGKNATIAISNSTTSTATDKYYAPIRLGADAHIGTIGVDETVTGNTKTTVTLTGSYHYGIYSAGTIDAIGGENANVSITGSLYGIYSGGDIETIGGETAEITITGSYYGIYLCADQEIGQIGGKNATINISQTSAGASSTYYSPIYLGSGAHIGTIGVDETVTGNTETTVTLTASAYYGIYAAGGIDTIGGENANVSISGTLYGIYLCADQEIGQIGGKNATINISQSTSSGSSKYYAPIRLGAGAHIGTIGVDETVTGNTKTTVTLTASYYYGIYSAGTIDAIGGPQAEITITAPRYAVRLTSGGSVGTIGTGNDTVTLESTSSGSYYGLYLEASSSVGTIGGGNSSNVTIQGVTRSCYVVAGAEITTIGTEGSTVTFKTTSTASNNRSNLYVYGSVGTIGGAGSTVSFSGARGYSGAGYGIYVEGSVGLIGDTNSTITLSGTSRNTTNYYRGICVSGGGTVTQIGSTGAAISVTETNSTKYGFGIWVANGTIGSIGNGAAITITTYNGIVSGSTTAGYAGTITTLGSDTGSIKITASNAGIYTYRNYSGTGTIATIGGNVQVSSSKYGIYNNGVIGEMADGLVLVTTGGTSYYTVYNSEATTTTVTETTTDEEGNEVSTEVVYDVPAGSITKVSGGEYYHKSGRDYIFSDGVDMVNYAEGKTLSSDTQSVTLFTNKAYNCYYITCGHTNTGKKVENQVNPTCTENGSYDRVVYCTDCEAEVSRDTVTLSAIGHSYEAVVTEPTCQTAGYTTYTCSACADSYTDNYVASSDDYHNYVNGVCNVCEGRQGSETSVKFKIYATNIAVGDALDLYFYVRASDLGDSKDNYYAELERKYANGTSETVTVAFSAWEKYSETLYRFCYSDIAAKEMTDEITATVYHSGDTEAASESYTETVRSYALRLLKTLGNSNKKQSRALVDMLNYGAACQTYFGYNTDRLANAGEEAYNYQIYATTGATCKNNLVMGDGNLFAVSVSAKNSLMFTFYFKNINENMTAKVSYTDHHGVPHTLTLSGDTFYDLNNDGSVFGVDVTGVSFASGRSVLKCEVYDGDKLVASASDSVEGYIARQGDSRADVYTKLLYFIDSTYNLFA